MKRKSNVKLFRILVSASILVWVFVIIVTLLLLQIKGGLTPYAANNNEIKIAAEGKVLNTKEAGIGGAKITLSSRGINKYIFADSGGEFLITGVVPGTYEILIEAGDYLSYTSSVELDGGRDYSFTLHKENTKND